MTKEDNLGDANKLYLTLHEANSLHSEKGAMGQKAGIFYRAKNQGQ